MVTVCLGNARQMSSESNRIHITMFSFVGVNQVHFFIEFGNVIHVFDELFQHAVGFSITIISCKTLKVLIALLLSEIVEPFSSKYVLLVRKPFLHSNTKIVS